MENKPALSKKDLYGYVVGSAIDHTGKSVILAVLIASIVYLFAYWYTVSLSSMVPIGGADYGYIFVSSPTLSGVYGLTNLLWLLGNCVYATGAVEYIAVFVPALKPHIGISAAVLITFFMVVDYVGVGLGAKVEGVMTVILTTSVLVFIAIGFTMVNPGEFFHFTVENPFFTNGFIGFSKSLGLCIWVIGGIGTATITFVRDVETHPHHSLLNYCRQHFHYHCGRSDLLCLCRRCTRGAGGRGSECCR